MSLPPSCVIVLGSINIDLVMRGPRLPRPGETVLGGEFYRAYGGKGANQAVAAARATTARAAVSLIAAVGDDPFGAEARAHLAAEQISCRYVRSVAGQATGTALILVDQTGENLISVASGANSCLSTTDVDQLPDELFETARVFVACLESPEETVLRGLQRARRAGLLTILNPAPANPRIASPDWLAVVDLLTPNVTETIALTGVNPQTTAEAARAGRILRQRGCGRVVITRGADGCVVIDDDVTIIPAAAVVALDATAAGDAFTGALAAALVEGRSLVSAARWANLAAGLAVTRKGAQASLPRRAEILAAAESAGVASSEP
jgi:ribokinase